jgi:hypothetical protein
MYDALLTMNGPDLLFEWCTHETYEALAHRRSRHCLIAAKISISITIDIKIINIYCQSWFFNCYFNIYQYQSRKTVLTLMTLTLCWWLYIFFSCKRTNILFLLYQTSHLIHIPNWASEFLAGIPSLHIHRAKRGSLATIILIK